MRSLSPRLLLLDIKLSMKKVLFLVTYFFLFYQTILSQISTNAFSIHVTKGIANVYSNYSYKDNPYMQPVELYIPRTIPIWEGGIRYTRANSNKFGYEINGEWAKRGSYRRFLNWKDDLRYINFSFSENYFLYPTRTIFALGVYVGGIQRIIVTSDDGRAAAKSEATIRHTDAGLLVNIHQQVFKISSIICSLDFQSSYGILGIFKGNVFKEATHNISLSGGLSLGYIKMKK